MLYLDESELKNTYFHKATNMKAADVKQFLALANSYAFGYIGGNPPDIPGDDKATLKSAISLAFQLFSKSETFQVDEDTGNVTEAAPADAFVRSKERDPWETVDAMLKPYRDAFLASNTAQSDRGVVFL